MIFKIALEEFQQDVMKYLQRVQQGTSYVVMQGDKPLAELIPVPDLGPREPRPFGLAKGDFVVPDNFNDPLTAEEVLRLFGAQ